MAHLSTQEILMRSVNPATGDVLKEFSPHSDEDVEQRIQAAQNAFPAWRSTSFSERADLITSLGEKLRAGVDEYARWMSLEMGKPIEQARGEVKKCAWVCDYYAENGAAFLEPEAVDTDAARSHVRFDPLGVILAIMPWNFPFWQVFRFAVPTVMAGNVALLKHASSVGGCAEHISNIFEEAGFPDGVFNHLLIGNEKAGEVIRHPAIRGVALTGSTRAGKSVGAAAGETLKPCVLELGGSDPFVVLADCDLDRTVEKAVYARVMNNGQSCIAAKRFIIEDSIYDSFVEKMQSAFEELTLGDPTDENTDVGPMAREDLRDELHKQVQKSIDQGARCLVGGKPGDGPGYFYEPTILVDVTSSMVAFCEETFGPVAAVIRAKNADHAIELANDSDFGLGASIWTTDDRGEEYAKRLEAGAVSVNEIVKSDPRLPFGGIKDSGFGRELSHYGIREFVNIKSVYVHE